MRRVIWQCLWLAGVGVIISMCMTAFLSYYLYPGQTPPLPPLLLAAAACAAADVGASTAVRAASTAAAAATPTTLAHSLLHHPPDGLHFCCSIFWSLHVYSPGSDNSIANYLIVSTNRLCSLTTQLTGAAELGGENWSWNTSLMYGAMVAATDPVAVAAVMKELGTCTTAPLTH